MNDTKGKKIEDKKSPLPPQRKLIFWVILILGIMYMFRLSSVSLEGLPTEVGYARFYSLVQNNRQTGQIRSAIRTDSIIKGEFSDGGKFIVNIPLDDPDLMKVLRENVAGFDIKPPRTLLVNIVYSLGPMILLILFFWFFVYRGATQAGGKILSFGKSRARESSGDKIKITFKDVAGVDEAKEELQEIIEFLRDPKKFQKLGGKIPKGVLLMGLPGTGKTLLAKAVSGEANVSFFSISGSDFVEMFVGVGASRVRDLFEQAKKAAKTSGKGCIIFIDEIDAVGRQRFAGIGGGHDEREQTLNALLVEMDGFNTHEGVILVAATNRPDVLDPALLRPGRFDRQIVISLPDIVGREGILKVHARNIKLSPKVDLKSIARQTSGFSGADIANLTNEAALLAARNNKNNVEMSDFETAIERVIAGPEKKSRVINEYEKNFVAYHEAGHALISLLIPGVDPLHKVSIIPRGVALGYTMQLPVEDRYITTESELMDKLTSLLGGRASEELIFNEVTSGAQNDLELVTQIARKMVCEFGMSKELGNLTFGRKEHQVFLGRDLSEDRNYSDETAQVIDQEIRKIVDTCYERAKSELKAHIDKLKLLAETLKEKEVMLGGEVRKLLKLPEPKDKKK